MCLLTEPQLSTTYCTSSGIAFSNTFLGFGSGFAPELPAACGTAPTLTVKFPSSIFFSKIAILLLSELTSLSIAGFASFINAISIKTRFCDEYLICPESSERILMYRIITSTLTICASSFKASILSADASITSIISSSSDVLINIRFLKYHIKSLTNCPGSLPCIIISSRILRLVVTSESITLLVSLLNISLSTAPRTSSTLSYVNFCPK